MARRRREDDPAMEATVQVTKLLRVDAAIQAARSDAAAGPLDAEGLARLDAVARRLLLDIGNAVPEPLLEELAELLHPFDHVDRSADEVRLSLALLAGWVDGLERALTAA